MNKPLMLILATAMLPIFKKTDNFSAGDLSDASCVIKFPFGAIPLLKDPLSDTATLAKPAQAWTHD